MSVAASPCSEIVVTGSGKLRGVDEPETGACAWRGIPFAAPPIGDFRWKPPQPAKPWKGIRDADLWGPRCVQKGGLLMDLMGPDPSGRMSEDCLYLNVWRPTKKGTYPVIVYFHGGGLGLGSANTPIWWGDRLASEQDIVVVTAAYRLNVFGFLALPALRDEDADRGVGGYGTLDQVTALRWFRDNIEAFGGDPGNVTIFGTSGGGWSVCTLMATPLAEGLFHQTVMASGGCGRAGTVEQGFERGRAFAKKAGCGSSDLECLRGLDADEVMGAIYPYPTWTYFSIGPHVDGHLLSATPLEMIRSGGFNRVPFLAGTNRNEMSLQLAGARGDLASTPPEAYGPALRTFMPLSKEAAAELQALYPLASFGGSPMKAYQMMVSDLSFICPTLDALVAVSDQGVPAYGYRFDFQDVMGGARFGVMHGMDIPFVFDSFDRAVTRFLYNKSQTAKARKLGKLMQAYWAAFARTGAPGDGGITPWPPFSKASPMIQLLGEKVRTAPSKIFNRCAFWEKHPVSLGW